jgi:hypothetical protein
MYLNGAMEGKRISFRSIAMTLGVTMGAVQYWRDQDRWEVKVNQALTEYTLEQTESASNLANLLRASLYDNMKVLNNIIRDPKMKPIIRIKAISEYADICNKLKVIQPEDLTQTLPAKLAAGFKDDLDAASSAGIDAGDGRGSVRPTAAGYGSGNGDVPSDGAAGYSDADNFNVNPSSGPTDDGAAGNAGSDGAASSGNDDA